MLVKRSLFHTLALCTSVILLGGVGCLPAVNPNSFLATATFPTFTLAPPTSTVELSPAWSATPDDPVSSSPPLQSNAVWTATPGWLTPPSPTFTPSDLPTATILFDTPKPGQEQGVRGTVSHGGGPADENGTAPSAGHAGGVRVFVLASGTKRLVAETVTGTAAGAYGMYEIKLPPGRYDVCIYSFYDLCTPGVIVTAGVFVNVELEIPE